MANWKDDLKRKVRNPAEDEAEARKKEAEERARPQRSVAGALQVIGRAFKDAQNILARCNPNLSSGFDSMNNSSLSDGVRTISAKQTSDRQEIVIAFDGKEEQLVFNRVMGALVLASDQQQPLEVEDFIGRIITRLFGG